MDNRAETFRARIVAPLPRRPAIDVVVPTYNEEAELARSVRRLHRFLRDHFPFTARITVADKASTDSTPGIADVLAAELSDVRVLHLNQKGRGRAIAAAWLTSDARVVAYMDGGLRTDLNALLPLVAPILSGHSDVAVGRAKRGLSSRAYNMLLRIALRLHFTDAQCGFKAVRADVARRLVPQVIDRGWFFDTELLVRADRAGMHIHEVPVDLMNRAESRVAS